MTPKHFDFGTAFHVALETYYNPETWTFPSEVRIEAAIKAFRDKNQKQLKKHLNATNSVDLDSEAEEDFKEREELGIGMLRYFHKEVVPKYDDHWKPLKVEIEFMVPIPNPDGRGYEAGDFIWCKCDRCWENFKKYDPDFVKRSVGMEVLDKSAQHLWEGLPVVYAGRIDALGEDEYGDLWIIDWKTAKTIRDDHTFLELDDQVGSYPWALWRLGIPVRGFLYHEQRKGYPQPPKQNKYRRLGCLYSVSKNQDVEYEFYRKFVEENDPEGYQGGHYDEYLEFLQVEGSIKYFERNQIHKTEDQLLEVERNIGLEALEMINPKLRVYPSPGRFSCDSCAFQQPCIEKSRGGDYQYGLDTMFEKREAYYLRSEPSTEKKSAE
jgi:hypothetical protein